jgi:hypothetical protein
MGEEVRLNQVRSFVAALASKCYESSGLRSFNSGIPVGCLQDDSARIFLLTPKPCPDENHPSEHGGLRG